jgi:hypothetical protein
MTTSLIRPRIKDAVSARDLSSQQNERTRNMRIAGEEAVAVPFEGITSGGALTSGLFPIESSGVSTAPIRAAAEAYLASLDAEGQVVGEAAVNRHPPVLVGAEEVDLAGEAEQAEEDDRDQPDDGRDLDAAAALVREGDGALAAEAVPRAAHALAGQARLLGRARDQGGALVGL